jgi:CheY-like chemotaxis protein
MPKLILVVDDEVRVVAVVQRLLESAGYKVVSAGNGADALKQVRSHSPDLVILDLVMPALSGYQVCTMLKRDDCFKHIPILMLTARSQARDAEEAVRVGTDAYMVKPFKNDVLLARVAELLAAGEEAARAREAQEAPRREKAAKTLRSLLDGSRTETQRD